MAYFRTLTINSSKKLQAYVVGLAIGDGNLSNPNGRATRLRITCDDRYPALKLRIQKTLQKLLPQNRVGVVQNKKNCSDVYVYSNHLEKLLGWKAKGGSKFIQQVKTPNWIKSRSEYIIPYLRGLIETDGAIYTDRGYPMVIFTSILEGLAIEVKNLIEELGFKAHLYKLVPQLGYNRHPFYHVRLSKDVERFLDIVQPDKS